MLPKLAIPLTPHPKALAAAGHPVTGARLAQAVQVSPSYGRALLAEFQADLTLGDPGRGNRQQPDQEVEER